jgi:hypothetical protein
VSNVISLCDRRERKRINSNIVELVAAYFIERNINDHAAYLDGDIDALEGLPEKHYQHADYYKGYQDRIELESQERIAKQ